MKKMIYILSLLFFLFNCSDDKIIDKGENNNGQNVTLNLIDDSQASIVAPYFGQSYNVLYKTDLEETLYNRITATVDGSNAAWCKVSVERATKTLKIEVLNNNTDIPREAVIKLGNADVSLEINVYQQEFISTEIGEDWKKLEILSGWAPDYLDDKTKIEKAFDGDVATYFNAKQGEASFPYEVKFTLNTTNNVSYFTYYPRRDSGTRWGQFGEVEVWYNTADNNDFVKAGRFDFKEELSEPSTGWFDTPIKQPKEIMLKVFSGYNNRVSIGEVEFYAKTSEAYDYSAIFADKAASVLRSGISMQDIEKIPEAFYKNIASQIFKGTYDNEYRIQKYRPYQDPGFDASEFKTAKYSRRDNATGMYYNDLSENLIVFVDDLKGQNISLNILDYSESANEGVSYPLKEGVNILKPSKKGHIYIFYLVDDPLPLHPATEQEKKAIDNRSVKIHIASGRVNGLFDIRKHTQSDWPNILSKTVSNEIDIMGIHSHVVWNVQDYIEYNTNIELMTNYIDNLVKQQHEFMGLYHYNRSFKNRQYIRVDYFVPAAYASDYKTVYRQSGYKEVFCSEDGFKRRLWVLGHEVGHTNQVRPGVKWHGTTEITNNIYALYNQKCVHGEARRLTTGTTSQGYAGASDGYDWAFENIINANENWYFSGDKDRGADKYLPRLVPFWQLYLYFVEIDKQEHFYHDIFEHYRNNSSPSDDGLRQLDFIRTVCNVGKTNMIDFFEKWGMLTPIDIIVDDYGEKRIVVTETQINNLKSEIISKGYPTPAINVHELTDSNYKQFIK